nr:unnamed protein product [Naegleria fowleri]
MHFPTEPLTQETQQNHLCFRLHCFMNGDWERREGKIILFDFMRDDPDNFEKLKKSIVTLLCPVLYMNHHGSSQSDETILSKLRLFSKHGTEFTNFEQIRDDDVLFLSCFAEDFSNVRLKMMKQSSLVNISSINNKTTTDVVLTEKATTTHSTTPTTMIITNIINSKSIKMPFCNCSSIAELKKQLLNNQEYMEGLFGNPNYPLKFVEDVILISNGKELKDSTCCVVPTSETLSNFHTFLLTKKPQYFVKLMMEGGRTIIVDSEAITFESTVAEFKKFVEKRMRVNMTEMNENRKLVLLWNQQKILDESKSIGEAFPSQSTLCLVFV